MVRVLAFLPDSTARKRLANAVAFRERAWNPSLAFAAGWAEARALACASPPELLVFDPYAAGSFDPESILAFTEQFASCILVAYGAFPHGCARDVLELGRSGVHGVATQEVDDAPHTLAGLLDRALEYSMLVQALALLERRTPPSIRDLLPRLLFRTQDNLTPAQVAHLCHCHPKTLRARLRSAGLPSLAKLIVWTRLIRACHLLQDTGRSVESVALVLGFASANSFRNQLLRYAGVRPTDLRETGNPRFLLARFQLALRLER